MTNVHQAASVGYTANADSYVRGRPDYPPELAGWLAETLGLRPGASVVDLGAGTGKFTPRLVATGARVIAVEPVASMRAKLAAAQPGVEVLEGAAQAIPLDDASVDAVVCAQSFHWFANGEALSEIHRVLKPGGKLGLVWNLRDFRVPWVAKLDAIVNRYEGDAPRFYTGEWRHAFPHKGFDALAETHFSIGHTGSPDDVIVHRVRSTSFIAALPEAERVLIDDEVRALIEAEPELRGKDVVTVPYTTAAFVAVRK
ncbi:MULTISPECIES: methyltransferase domain-containing protein [unclassified Caballeronia]|uniref:class I SAM-dependent methyltransferase n=1 Tax=unclassified Caballeronia TaxID=2646786 RepID=UPI00285E26AD|nr:MULTISPECIES: methyltransferase domain-containing protein [unclassified Caballeronia]MDR5775639.1 methyltransferase domain-containing protein [Caballeronia sp. LZ002]MDR5851077.1 methyltransferase domain-containing protein [Caballeronia sp. LZ003]